MQPAPRRKQHRPRKALTLTMHIRMTARRRDLARDRFENAVGHVIRMPGEEADAVDGLDGGDVAQEVGEVVGLLEVAAVAVDDLAEQGDLAHALFGEAADLIASVRDIAHRFGGSHAQRDILSLTLIDAARRAGRASLARHVLAERLVAKPGGAWGRRILARIDATSTATH